MIIDDDQTDLFPTAEVLFREHQEEILWLERRRRNMVCAAFLSCILVGVFCLCAIPLALESLQQHYLSATRYDVTGHIILAIVTALGFAVFQYKFIDSLYRRLAKRKFLPVIARALRMDYRRAGYFLLTSVYDHHIIPPYTTRVVEEGFAGKFKGFRIEFQDFFLSPVRHALGLWDYYGLALKVELNKSLFHHTVLLPAREQKRVLALLPNAQLFLHEDVNLVYHSFTRHYVCLSTHQIEARYVMDPAVMERFTRLAEAFDTDRISASFMHDEMVVLMRPVKNLFEVGSLRDPVTVLTIERTLQQINALRQMAEIFELNDKAGLGARV